jgi:hypothetical protein
VRLTATTYCEICQEQVKRVAETIEARLLAWNTGERLYYLTEAYNRLMETERAGARLHRVIATLIDHYDLTQLQLAKMTKEGSNARLVQFVAIVRHLVGKEA